MCPHGGPRWTVCTFCLGSDTGPGWSRCGLSGLHSAGDYPVRPPSPSFPGLRDMYLKVMTLYSDDRCASLSSSLSPVVRRGGLTTELLTQKASPPRLLPGSVFAILDSFLAKGSPNYMSFSPLPLHPVIFLQPPSLLIQHPGSSSSPQMLRSLCG